MILSSAILSWASWLTIRCAGVSFESVFSPLFLVGISAFSSRRLYCRAQFLSLNLRKKNKVRDLCCTSFSHWPVARPASFSKLFHGSRNRHPVLISIPKTVQGNNTSFKNKLSHTSALQRPGWGALSATRYQSASVSASAAAAPRTFCQRLNFTRFQNNSSQTRHQNNLAAGGCPRTDDQWLPLVVRCQSSLLRWSLVQNNHCQDTWYQPS